MFEIYHLVLLIPLGWLLISFCLPRVKLQSAFTVTRFMSYLGMFLTVLMAALTAIEGPIGSSLLGWNGIGLSVRIDALSMSVLSLISFIAILVLRYSEQYLEGDERHSEFMAKMCLTIASTTLLVISGNVLQFVFAWIATSLALHTLLVFYKKRHEAVIAAKKKWLTARLGDALLLFAVALLVDAFGTTDITTMFASAANLVEIPSQVHMACVGIMLAALLKSAQFPTHGWLLEVMETPTPVSALLHAGIINAGGFLILRFADLVVLNPAGMHVVAIVGGFTALFAGFVMLTQSAVKTALAWSTIAQMGFMMLQCGLGAFPIAVLHLIAHSLYKAHAFLSSGSIIDVARTTKVPKSKIKSQPLRILLSVVAASCMYLATSYYILQEHVLTAVNITLGLIFVMGITHLVVKSLEDNPGLYSMMRTLLTAFIVSVIYNLLHLACLFVYSPLFPQPAAAGLIDYLVIALTLLSFSVIMILQIIVPDYQRTTLWSRIYVHLLNGFYFNAWFDRLAGSYQVKNTTTSQS